jgi:PleD family two-component response regulator
MAVREVSVAGSASFRCEAGRTLQCRPECADPLGRTAATGADGRTRELAEAVTPIVVLLVEDSAAIRALVRRMLVAGGHSVVEAAGGAAALAACREQQPTSCCSTSRCRR